MHGHNQIQKKHYVFFVVLGNGQVLLRMPDIATLKILNLSIDSIQVEIESCKNKQKAGNTQGHRGLHKHKHSWSHQTNSQWSNPVKQVN